MQRRIPITLDALLHADRTLFQACPGDEETPANLTIAEVKEMMVAINVSNERILRLYQDVQKAEERIEALELRLNSIPSQE